MGPAELLVLGAAIGANNLAVALALGALGQARRRVRIATVFGLFEFAVPLAGLLIGREAAGALAGSGRWVGVGLLAALGLWTLRPGGDLRRDLRLAERATTWRGLTSLAAGLSLDNLVVGFALGLGGTAPAALAAVIAGFAVVFSVIGLQLGAAGRRRWERRAEAAAGVVLLLVAAAVGAGLIG